MKLAIMQPYLFPYIGYFQLIAAVDAFIAYDDVNFIKSGWINRNRILMGGQAAYFTVPLSDASSFMPICKVRINEHTDWRDRLLKSIRQAYARAPQRAEVMPLVESVLRRQDELISEMAKASVLAVCEYLEVRPQWISTSSAYGNEDLKGSARVLDLCRREGADHYINAIGGIALYSPDEFASRGIRLNFLQPRPIEYRQAGAPFVPWLSILDVLMFNPREQVQAMLEEYDLI